MNLKDAQHATIFEVAQSRLRKATSTITITFLAPSTTQTSLKLR